MVIARLKNFFWHLKVEANLLFVTGQVGKMVKIQNFEGQNLMKNRQNFFISKCHELVSQLFLCVLGYFWVGFERFNALHGTQNDTPMRRKSYAMWKVAYFEILKVKKIFKKNEQNLSLKMS